MKLICTIAVGGAEWGALSLNLSLSIKATTPQQKTCLIYNDSAIKGIEPLIEQYFDYGIHTNSYDFSTPHELAFYLKTQLYDIVTKGVPDADEIIFMDADSIMIPSGKSDDWFDKFKDINFTCYCNDIFDFKTKKRKRKDYTWWCEPLEAQEYFAIPSSNKMPQLNTSFMFFRRGLDAMALFAEASKVWNDEGFTKFKKYKNVKPDEFCFNVACAKLAIYPHKELYRPIYLRFASEIESDAYIIHYYKALGFAGERAESDKVLDFYNRLSDYYRMFHGIKQKFHYSNASKAIQDNNKLLIKPLKRRTLFRQGEVANSDGGIFNPDAIITPNGELMTILRKEINHDVYKNIYTHTSAIPFVYFNEEKYYDLKTISYPDAIRLEDFRLFVSNGEIMCNHTIIFDMREGKENIKCCLSYIRNDDIFCIGVPELPISLNKMEKNWAFFSEGDFIYCIYSLNPYRLFVTSKSSDYQLWDEVEVKKPQLKWFHYRQYICNSTNPILIGDYYLMFFHTKESSTYFHGACLINKKTKEIEYCAKNSLDIPATQDGRQKGLLYVSGSVCLERLNVVRIYFGDGDSHAGYADFHKDLLIEEIKKYRV